MHPKRNEIVWTPELAYAVGLITTDGCLSSDKRHIDFTSKDKPLIETFERCVNINNKISPKKNGAGIWNAWRVQFSDVTLYRWLEEIGLMPNKSKRMGALKIPDELFIDFLRGHFDGDGSIKRYQDPVYPRSVRLYTVFLSPSFTHLNWLKEKIEDLICVSGFLQNSAGVYRLTYAKYNSIAILNELYARAEAPRLERKFIVAKEFLTMPR